MRLTLFVSLAFAPASAAAPPLEAILTPTEVEFRAGGKLVTRYRHAGVVRAPKGDATQPLAKPYCYPLLTPSGQAVTRAWPLERGRPGETTDHFHQKSLWFCHGDVVPEGLTWSPKSRDPHVRGVDFWTEEPGHGRIVCDAVEAVTATPDRVAVATTNRWLTPDGQQVLSERRTISLRTLPGVAGPVLQIDIRLTAHVPVTFGDTKEGAFGVRVADAMRLTVKGSAGAIVSSTGVRAKAPAKDNLPLWGERADWHDYSGDTGGVAVFAAPENPAPSAWHSRAYGLMAANPFARAKSGFPALKATPEPEVKLAKGETLTLRFGVYAHDAGADAATAFAAWK